MQETWMLAFMSALEGTAREDNDERWAEMVVSRAERIADAAVAVIERREKAEAEQREAQAKQREQQRTAEREALIARVNGAKYRMRTPDGTGPAPVLDVARVEFPVVHFSDGSRVDLAELDNIFEQVVT